MWYLTEINDNTSVKFRTLEELLYSCASETLIVKHINKNFEDRCDDAPYFINIPYYGNTTIGDVTVAVMKNKGHYSMLVGEIVSELKEQVLDVFEFTSLGNKQVAIIDETYMITRDAAGDEEVEEIEEVFCPSN